MEMYSGKCIKLLLIWIVLMTLVRDNDAWWSRRRRQPPPPRPKPDRTKPTFTYCPTRLGPFYQTNRTHLDLRWEIPRATDNSGHVEVTETRKPIVMFIYDDYTISVQYRATDRAGNYATCSFVVEVHIIRCPSLGIYRGYTRCSNTDSVSSVCTHSCMKGYNLVGLRTRRCYRSGNNAYWTGSKSYCIPVTCPVPVSDVTTVSCSYRGESSITSERQNYTAYCIFECKDGYSYVEGSVFRSCLASGDWDGIPLLCRDITPPELVCPDDIVLTADPLMTSIQWSRWEPIVASDLGIDIEATTYSINSTGVGSNRPPSLPEGYHKLVYRAVDSSGNAANCSFTVTVRVCRCPPLSLPDKSIVTLVSGVGSCNGRVVYGSVCAVSCEIGYTLSSGGTSLNKTCLISDQNLNGTWSGPDPVCDARLCEPLTLPLHGIAISECERTYGSMCQISCSKGYRLVGSSNGSCEFNGSTMFWQFEEEPVCENLPHLTKLALALTASATKIIGTLSTLTVWILSW